MAAIFTAILLPIATVCLFSRLFCFCVQEASEGRSLSGLDAPDRLQDGPGGGGLSVGARSREEPSSSCRSSGGRGLEPVGSLVHSFSSCSTQGANNARGGVATTGRRRSAVLATFKRKHLEAGAGSGPLLQNRSVAVKPPSCV